MADGSNSLTKKKETLSLEGCGYMLKNLQDKIHNYIYLFKNRDERLNYLNGIESLLDEYLTITENMDDEERKKTDPHYFHLPIPLFKLAYYGENIKSIGEKMIRLYRLIYNELIAGFDLLTQIEYNKFNTERKDKRIRVLFVSDRLGGFSSVMRDRGQIILSLCGLKKLFVVGVMAPNPTDHNGKLIKENSHLFFELKENTFMNIETVGRGVWDIIIYCDLHMGQFVSTMSLIRLAPLQLTTFGHSESSFTADGFISSQWFEPLNYKDNYGEKEVYLLESLNMKYPALIHPEIIKGFKSRLHFGFSEDQHLYLITSSLFKISYEMFEVFKEILIRDNKAVIIITKMKEDYDKPFFEKMQEVITPDLLGRIRFIERLGIPAIYNLMYISDIILESFPFGNLNTTMEAFELNLPLICLPSHKLNGRFTFGLINKLISYCNDDIARLMIADNIDDYINKAVHIVNNKDDRIKLKEYINNNKNILFMDNNAVNEWSRLLMNLSGFYKRD